MCPKYRKKGFWEPPNGLCWTVFAQQHHGLCCGLPLKSWVALRPYINRQACMTYDSLSEPLKGRSMILNWITVDCMKRNVLTTTLSGHWNYVDCNKCKFFIMSTEFDKNISDWCHDPTDHKNGNDFFMGLIKWPKIAVKKSQMFQKF